MHNKDKLKTQVAQLEKQVKQKMTKEALERYGRVKMAHPDRAMQALALMAHSVEHNKTQRIDDTTLRRLLKKVIPHGNS